MLDECKNSITINRINLDSFNCSILIDAVEAAGLLLASKLRNKYF